VLYIGLNGISTSVGKVAYAATLAPTASLSGASGTQKEVTMDFLYADWCAHCQKMKPIVEKLVAELPSDRFQVNYWSDADYQAGKPGTVAVFDKYSNNGMFLGVLPVHKPCAVRMRLSPLFISSLLFFFHVLNAKIHRKLPSCCIG
jgi:thiol-disulfide isomerase/thioredoxin